MAKFFARKTVCLHGHNHASKAEADRCVALHHMEAGGKISGLMVEPRFVFIVNGRHLKMRNGQFMRYTADFAYQEASQKVVEEVKAKNGFMSRDVPIKLSLMAACHPDIDLRIIK